MKSAIAKTEGIARRDFNSLAAEATRLRAEYDKLLAVVEGKKSAPGAKG